MWRRPGVLATVVGACAVMTASAASVPLFLSSVGTESVALQAAERCPRDTGVSLRLSPRLRPGHVRPWRIPSSRWRIALGPSNRWLRLERTRLAGADPADDDTPASLLVRDDALEHVRGPRRRGRTGRSGSATAPPTLTGLGVGDQATVGGVAQVPVTGVYRDLSGSTVDRFWCSNGDMLLPEGRELVPPPPLVLADRETFASLMRALEVSLRGGQRGRRPSETGSPSPRPRTLVHALACGPGGAELRWCAGGRPLLPGSPRFNSGPTEAEMRPSSSSASTAPASRS